MLRGYSILLDLQRLQSHGMLAVAHGCKPPRPGRIASRRGNIGLWLHCDTPSLIFHKTDGYTYNMWLLLCVASALDDMITT